MRSIVYKLEDASQIGAELSHDMPIELPQGEDVTNGEWILAIFELSPGGRATAAAGRGVETPDGPRLSFDPRDGRRLADFFGASAPPPSSSGWATPAAPPAPPMPRSGSTPDLPPAPPPSSVRIPLGPGSLAAASSWGGAEVMLIDDDRDVLQVVGAMLEAVGLRVSSFETAERALERAAERAFDLLVVDWKLPGMSGLDLCRSLRRAGPNTSTPVLFLSANASSQDMVEAFASGADDYVVKPFRAPELGARIYALLRRARLAGQAPRSP